MNSFSIDTALQKRLIDFLHTGRKLTVLTGAGLSEPSGVPTYVDGHGCRRQGLVIFLPEEIRDNFAEKPLNAWASYLHLREPILTAIPNNGHVAVRALETIFGDRFQLVTQNIDNLHRKAGSSADRMCVLHDTNTLVYCSNRCTDERYLPRPCRSRPVSSLRGIKSNCSNVRDAAVFCIRLYST